MKRPSHHDPKKQTPTPSNNATATFIFPILNPFSAADVQGAISASPAVVVAITAPNVPAPRSKLKHAVGNGKLVLKSVTTASQPNMPTSPCASTPRPMSRSPSLLHAPCDVTT
ncbi:MAG: hypothetical protein Q9173_005393 [Seirophora scorigena]